MKPAGSEPEGPADPIPDPIEDAALAAQLFLIAPHLFGGMVLRGSSPARDAVLGALMDAMQAADRPVRKLPGHVDDERLLGGVDIASSLASGRAVHQRGLLDECAGGAVIVPMAERIEPRVAGRLAQRADEGVQDGAGAPALILLDDAHEADDAPPASLLERTAFHAELAGSRAWEVAPFDASSVDLDRVAPLDSASLEALAATAQALGVASLRPLIFAQSAARAHAALEGRDGVEEADLAAAVRLILSPRATRLPPMEDEPPPEDQPPEDQPPETPPDPGEEQDESQQPNPDAPLEETLVEAAKAAIPADLLAALAQGKAPRRVTGGGTGKRRKSGLRGKPLGARQGMPRGGARLALMDTLRAAVPWQEVRRRETGAHDSGAIQMRKEDLRVRRFEDKAARVTIFAVDASGSAAAARLAEAKGAVELMLAQAYVTRSEVALIAFRGESAELLLPPTRSLTRARRALSELPGGGGTPLAMGLDAARECAEAVASKGRTPSLVVLTDGRANIGRDGQPGRKQAGEDAIASAKALARMGLDAIVIDISARAAREGQALADAMNARFLALPRADARQIASAVEAARPLGQAA